MRLGLLLENTLSFGLQQDTHEVRNLGGFIDSDLTLSSHIKSITIPAREHIQR